MSEVYRRMEIDLTRLKDENSQLRADRDKLLRMLRNEADHTRGRILNEQQRVKGFDATLAEYK